MQKLCELNVEQVKMLRKEVKLGSLFDRSYENTFGIEPKECKEFFNDYVNYLVIIANNDPKNHVSDSAYEDEAYDYDNLDDRQSAISQYDNDMNLAIWFYAFKEKRKYTDKDKLEAVFKRLYRNCELYAILLDSFSHHVLYFDENGRKHIDGYSACAPEQHYAERLNEIGNIVSFNEDRTKVLFAGYNHNQHQFFKYSLKDF